MSLDFCFLVVFVFGVCLLYDIFVISGFDFFLLFIILSFLISVLFGFFEDVFNCVNFLFIFLIKGFFVGRVFFWLLKGSFFCWYFLISGFFCDFKLLFIFLISGFFYGNKININEKLEIGFNY